MERRTAYTIAIESLIEKRRRHYAFDHHMHLMFTKAGYPNEATLSAHKNFVRIDEAIKMLEAERDHKQFDLLSKYLGGLR
jgi:hypothetical protein